MVQFASAVSALPSPPCAWRRGAAAATLALVLCCELGEALAEPSAGDKAAAAEAFDRGTAKWLGKDYAEAARYFETAHRLAPAAGALLQAVRSHERAGDTLRASTLALRLAAEYPGDAAAQKTARAVLDKHAGRYVRVEVACTGCTLELDGKLVDSPTFYIAPGDEATVAAAFDTGVVSKNVFGKAGETVQVSFEAPPRAETPTAPAASPTPARDEPSRPPPPPAPAPGLPWAVPAVLGGLTVVAGAALTWSGLDTLDERDAYEASPTRARFENGRDLELRTNVLIAVTAVLGAATIATTVLALPGDEPRRDAAKLEATVGAGPDGASAVVRGSFW